MSSDDEASQDEIEYEEGEVIFEDLIEEDIIEREIKTKRSPPIMWEYEKTNIIAKRKQQLDKGSLATVSKEMLKNVHSSYDIAVLEFNNGSIPYILKRVFDGGYYELWEHNDFEFFPI